MLIVPASATTTDESLVVAYDVYYAAAQLIFDRYGMRLLRADEGGLAPPCKSPEEMIELAVDAIPLRVMSPGETFRSPLMSRPLIFIPSRVTGCKTKRCLVLR